MQRRENFFLTFFIFLILSIVIFAFSKFGVLNGVSSVLSKVLSPFRVITFNSFSFIRDIENDTKIEKLKEENRNLIRLFVNQQVLKSENQALRDQFQTSNPKSQNLLPARIVGAPSFIPGISEPSSLILDKGTSDGVDVGDAVVLKNNLVGQVTNVNMFFSRVTLITDTSSSFTGKDVRTGAIGVISGEDKIMIFGNVLQSSDLKLSDIIVSKGDLDMKGYGYPPDFIVGKIISLQKEPSALFQKAEVVSLINFSSLSTVFVWKGQ